VEPGHTEYPYRTHPGAASMSCSLKTTVAGDMAGSGEATHTSARMLTTYF